MKWKRKRKRRDSWSTQSFQSSSQVVWLSFVNSLFQTLYRLESITSKAKQMIETSLSPEWTWSLSFIHVKREERKSFPLVSSFYHFLFHLTSAFFSFFLFRVTLVVTGDHGIKDKEKKTTGENKWKRKRNPCICFNVWIASSVLCSFGGQMLFQFVFHANQR